MAHEKRSSQVRCKLLREVGASLSRFQLVYFVSTVVFPDLALGLGHLSEIAINMQLRWVIRLLVESFGRLRHADPSHRNFTESPLRFQWPSASTRGQVRKEFPTTANPWNSLKLRARISILQIPRCFWADFSVAVGANRLFVDKPVAGRKPAASFSARRFPPAAGRASLAG